MSLSCLDRTPLLFVDFPGFSLLHIRFFTVIYLLPLSYIHLLFTSLAFNSLPAYTSVIFSSIFYLISSNFPFPICRLRPLAPVIFRAGWCMYWY